MLAKDKASTRKQLRQLRNEIPLAERRAAEIQSLTLLTRWPSWNQAATIASYLPHQSEFDPQVLIQHARSRGAIIVYPRVVDNGLTFHQWNSGEPLEPTIGGVNQPLATSPQAALGDIDLFITPLLACGDQGIRLGYGGGYYDRIFSQARGFRLGVGFSLQRVASWETEAHDKRLGGFLSESRLELFSPTR